MIKLSHCFILGVLFAAPVLGVASGDDELTKSPAATAQDQPDAESLPVFAPDDFVLLPLRIHALGAQDVPEIDASIDDEDIRRIVRKANRVWQAAGIRWKLESIVREPAAEIELFQLTQALKPQGWNHYLELRPESSLDKNLLHVYFVHELNVNGVYLGGSVAFVKETAKLREVEGGIDEPVPRVMSHELGHALGLPHRQDRTNLMSSGTTGTLFNAAEIRRAREHATKLESAATAGIMAQKAKEHYEAGRWSNALALDAELVTLPGESPLKDAAWVRCITALQCGVPLIVPKNANHGRRQSE